MELSRLKMETDKPAAISEFLYDVIKVELEEENATSHFRVSSNQSNLPIKFSEAEVTKDPRTGLSICMLCLEDLQPDNVTEHMVEVHKYRRVFMKCWNCEEIFQEKAHYADHKLSCQPQKTVKKKATMEELMKQATEEYNSSICPICLIEFSDTLEVHLEKEHVKVPPPPEAATCPTCNKIFKSRNALAQHKRYAHKRKDAVECQECGKKFAARNLLANHMRNVHPHDGKVHTCEECGKGYKSHQSLYQHIKHVHTYSRSKRAMMNQSDSTDSGS